VAENAEGANVRAVPALRALGWFWLLVLLLFGGSAGVLQWLGPPLPPPKVVASRAAPTHKPAPAPARVEVPVAQAQAGAATPRSAAPRAPGAPIPAPDPALLEASTAFPDGALPRIGSDGRQPLRAYAAGYDPADPRPKIGLLLAGFGMSESESEEAARSTPAAVSLAVSPYAFRPQHLLDLARAQGHELLVSVPMEPQGYPLDDPGNQALMTNFTAAANAGRLEWSLTRITGYVGATGALGNLRGERFAASESMDPVLEEIAGRGLLYVDPRPGSPRPPRVVGRGVDLVIDDPAVRPQIEARLAELEQIARDRGSALGLAGLPRPVTVDRIAAWARTLAERGLTLTPVSALVRPPPAPNASPTTTGNAAP
jgi:polysaccharide deacetylase 2 family uncharacterized protein YibQ